MYERDAFLTELDTEVIEIGRDEDRPFAVTTETVFYPEGGGQPSDLGIMGGVPVVDVQKSGGVIRHFFTGSLRLGPVHQVLDWDRRFDHMQQHTGQHLLTAIALGRFGWSTTAFHLGPSVSNIELDVPSLDDVDLRRLEDAVAGEILSAHPVTTRLIQMDEMEVLGVRSRALPEDHTGEIRLVEIEGLDLNTCGGTHVRSTAEVGSLALLGTEAMRGGTRVFFVAGDRVRRRLAENEARNLKLRTLLDAADDDLPELVELRIGREKQLAREHRQLLTKLADAEAERLAAGNDPVIAGHWADRELPFLQEIGRKLLELAPGRVALLTAGTEGEGAFLMVAGEASGLDLAVVGPEICAIFGGRGGGRAPYFQGKAPAVGRRIEAVKCLKSLIE